MGEERWTTLARLDEVLESLVGLPIMRSSRAADLESFQIGDLRERLDRRGRPFTVGAYALHVQSPWRIATSDRIVVAYRDLRYPRAGLVDPDFDPNDLGVTRREELLEEFFAEQAGRAVIEGCATSHLGDLRITLTGGYALEVFPDISDHHADEDPEYWRLLKDHGWHIVVSARGIMLLD